jgi:hypothetical protein
VIQEKPKSLEVIRFKISFDLMEKLFRRLKEIMAIRRLVKSLSRI